MLTGCSTTLFSMCSTTLCTAGCSTTLFTGFSKTLLTWRSHNLVDGVQHNFVHGGKKILLGKIVISYDLDCRAFNAFHGGYLPLLHTCVTFLTLISSCLFLSLCVVNVSLRRNWQISWKNKKFQILRYCMKPVYDVYTSLRAYLIREPKLFLPGYSPAHVDCQAWNLCE